jgi:TonB-linked SusC/RagA family outer membrane protein
LDELFKSENVEFEVQGSQIILSPKEMYSQITAVAEAAQQQKKTITGTIVDEAGQPLPGVTVVVKGTTQGTVTNADGDYSLTNIPEDATLVFSFVGMRTQEVVVGDRMSINVTMEVEAIGLDEVVAVGYGTQKRRNVTGAISQIDAEEMQDMPVPNIGQRLQGKFAGFEIKQTSGEPGGGLSFRIRGQASINGGNTPLVVVDGFPISTGIEFLNPDEIENISILKDASSAALYGSRAANGVILVTTKSGKVGQKNIEFSAYTGLERVSDRGKPNLMNAQEFAQFKKEYYEDAAKYEGYTGGVPEEYQNPEQVEDGTDWFDVLLRNALTQKYNLSLTTGTDKIKSSVNLSYSDQQGVVLDTYSKRYTARANNIFNVSEKIVFGLNVSGYHSNSQITPGIGNGRNILGSSFLMDPQLKYKNDDGTYPVSFSQPGMFANANYYLVLKERENIVNTTRALGNAFSEIELFDGLKYKLSANVDLGNSSTKSFTPSIAQGGMFSAPPNPATGAYETSNDLTYLIENTLTYSKVIEEDHNLDLLLGQSYQKSTYENSRINASEFPDDEISWFNVATTKVGTGDKGAWSILSYIGRLNYNFKGKYLLSAAFRRDGSSRFGANAKWGNFPSISLGWIITDENFMQNNKTFNYLKLRTSYGKVGNNNIGNYTHIASLVTSNYVFNNNIQSGKALNIIGNTNLTWETTKQFDIGLDIGILKDRIFVVYDYYNKITNGLLYAIDIPVQSGFSSIQSNIGEFKFWGHEIGIESKNFVGKFRWNTNFNISFNRNKAVKLGTNDTPIGGYGTYADHNRTIVGEPLGQFIGFVHDGIFMTQEELDSQPKHSFNTAIGTLRFKDINGDGEITWDDRTIIGDPNPNFIYGLTNEFFYKNFDASIVIAGSVGGDIIDGMREWTENIDGVFNVVKEVADRWRSPENPGKGKYPRTLKGTTGLVHYGKDTWVFDGSYLAVKNLTLGYSFDLKNNAYVKGLRLYLSGQNLIMLTNYPGMNPEVGNRGSHGLYQGNDQSSYPIPIIYSVGLNIKF